MPKCHHGTTAAGVVELQINHIKVWAAADCILTVWLLIRVTTAVETRITHLASTRML